MKAAKAAAKAEKKAAKAAAAAADDGGSYEEADSSSDEPLLSPGCSAALSKGLTGVLGVVLVICILGAIFGRKPPANATEAEMRKWEDLAEKRREAFAQGISEAGVRERGFKLYTWEEWQAEFLKKDGKPGESAAKAGEQAEKPKHENPELNAEIAKLKAQVAELTSGEKHHAQQVKDARKTDVPVPAVSKDQKSIDMLVGGKGATKEMAVKSAIRLGVLRSVFAWVGSRQRMEENRDKVKAILDTVTDADIEKFEEQKTQEKNGTVFVEGKIYIQKDKIAPKFAPLFPDVFANK